MFAEKRKRKPIPANIKKMVFERSKGLCENPKCRKPLKWGHKSTGKVSGIFHHTGDPYRTPTSKTVRFLCPDCHSRAHEYKTVRKRDSFWGIEKKKRNVIRKSFIDIRPKNKNSESKMVSYNCKISVSHRALYCGKKKASKSCLRQSLSGTKCPNLIISMK